MQAEQLRIFDIPQIALSRYPKTDALASKVNGTWVKISTAEYLENAYKVAHALRKMGFSKGDCIATVSNNRYEWNYLDIGMLMIGAVHVPMYPTISASDYAYILNDCKARLMVVSDQSLYNKVQQVKKDVSSLTHIYSFDPAEGATPFSDLLASGADVNKEEINRISEQILPKDLATLIYTSGTTGVPKGVMLSHRNLVSNCLASESLVPVDYHARALSFLPINHVYERMLCYLYQYMGISVYYAESMEKIADNIREIQPQLFGTVPRLIEKVFDKIMEKGHQLSGIKKVLFFWAVDVALQYEHGGKNGPIYALKLALANKLIFSKWREALGGNIKVIVSGSAPLQVRLAKVFWAAGMPVLEGYGLTETSPVISVNTTHTDGARFGSVGKPIEDVQVRIAADGEIQCKGPNLMLGYYNKPEETAAVMDQDWFCTGDIGEIDKDGFLRITDRKKEIFKTSGGKYVAPQPLENKMKESSFIEQICVVGEGQKFPGALVVPAFAYATDWLRKQGIEVQGHEAIAAHPKVYEQVKQEIQRMNQQFGNTEQIKKFVLLPKEFSVDGGELTPTLKFKRKIIKEKYASQIAGLYE
jgi:long-chain acyl-CoA synthetase